jgi:hypothetical protein
MFRDDGVLVFALMTLSAIVSCNRFRGSVGAHSGHYE